MKKPTLISERSGLFDVRNARSIDGQRYPNIDALYGVYDSKQEAFEALYTPNSAGVKALVAGRTVGVRENGHIVEYWLEEEKPAAEYTINDLQVKKAPSIVEIAIEPSNGEEFTITERNAIYRILSTSPRGSIFVGVLNSGQKFMLNVMENPGYYIITYIDGTRIEQLEISKDSHAVTSSYTEYVMSN